MAYQGNKNNNRPNDKRGDYANEKPKQELPKISLDYEQQVQLFGDVAEKYSKRLEEEKSQTRNKSTQIRRFYDAVLELNEKAQNLASDEQYKKEVYPFVIMLRSKVAYAKSRDLVSDTFEKMINQCVSESSSIKRMNNFKLFFEALIGFYPKK